VIERLLEAERMLSFGQLDHAEEIYRQVAGSDPKNSIAVVGLARVALERGDDLSSYLLARRALVIDPENDAARRLAVRLEEVEGRGSVRLVHGPHDTNDETATIEINDPQPGSGFYRFTLLW